MDVARVEAYTTVFVDGVGVTLCVWLVNARVELPICVLVLLVLLVLLTF
jgi:hypothetical protein